jgi:hypothetical protein
MMHLPRPHRPGVESKLAKDVLDWAETAFYVFWLLLTAVVAVLMLIHSWDSIRPIEIPF